MRFQIYPSTKLALRAAFAVALTIALVSFFHLSYPLWAGFAALLVVLDATNRQIALQRTVFLLLGSLAAALLYHLLPNDLFFNSLLLFQMILLICILCTIYFFRMLYSWALFFIGMLFLFIAVLWNSYSLVWLELRLVDAAIGGFCALLSTIIFSKRTQTTFMDSFFDNLEHSRRLFHTATHSYLSRQEEDIHPLPKAASDLSLGIDNLNIHLQDLRQERLLGNISFARAQAFALSLEKMHYFLQKLTDLVKEPSRPVPYAEIEQDLSQLFKETEKGFTRIRETLQRQLPNEILHFSPHLHHQLRQKLYHLSLEGSMPASEWSYYQTLIHYCLRLQSLLQECLFVFYSQKAALK